MEKLSKEINRFMDDGNTCFAICVEQDEKDNTAYNARVFHDGDAWKLFDVFYHVFKRGMRSNASKKEYDLAMSILCAIQKVLEVETSSKYRLLGFITAILRSVKVKDISAMDIKDINDIKFD